MEWRGIWSYVGNLIPGGGPPLGPTAAGEDQDGLLQDHKKVPTYEQPKKAKDIHMATPSSSSAAADDYGLLHCNSLEDSAVKSETEFKKQFPVHYKTEYNVSVPVANHIGMPSPSCTKLTESPAPTTVVAPKKPERPSISHHRRSGLFLDIAKATAARRSTASKTCPDPGENEIDDSPSTSGDFESHDADLSSSSSSSDGFTKVKIIESYASKPICTAGASSVGALGTDVLSCGIGARQHDPPCGSSSVEQQQHVVEQEHQLSLNNNINWGHGTSNHILHYNTQHGNIAVVNNTSDLISIGDDTSDDSEAVRRRNKKNLHNIVCFNQMNGPTQNYCISGNDDLDNTPKIENFAIPSECADDIERPTIKLEISESDSKDATPVILGGINMKEKLDCVIQNVWLDEKTNIQENSTQNQNGPITNLASTSHSLKLGDFVRHKFRDRSASPTISSCSISPRSVSPRRSPHADVVQELVDSQKFNMSSPQLRKRQQYIKQLEEKDKNDRTLIFDSSQIPRNSPGRHDSLERNSRLSPSYRLSREESSASDDSTCIVSPRQALKIRKANRNIEKPPLSPDIERQCRSPIPHRGNGHSIHGSPNSSNSSRSSSRESSMNRKSARQTTLSTKTDKLPPPLPRSLNSPKISSHSQIRSPKCSSPRIISSNPGFYGNLSQRMPSSPKNKFENRSSPLHSPGIRKHGRPRSGILPTNRIMANNRLYSMKASRSVMNGGIPGKKDEGGYLNTGARVIAVIEKDEDDPEYTDKFNITERNDNFIRNMDNSLENVFKNKCKNCQNVINGKIMGVSAFENKMEYVSKKNEVHENENLNKNCTCVPENSNNLVFPRKEIINCKQLLEEFLEKDALEEQRQQRFLYIASKMSGKLDSDIVKILEAKQQRTREMIINEKLNKENIQDDFPLSSIYKNESFENGDDEGELSTPDKILEERGIRVRNESPHMARTHRKGCLESDISHFYTQFSDAQLRSQSEQNLKLALDDIDHDNNQDFNELCDTNEHYVDNAFFPDDPFISEDIHNVHHSNICSTDALNPPIIIKHLPKSPTVNKNFQFLDSVCQTIIEETSEDNTEPEETLSTIEEVVELLEKVISSQECSQDEHELEEDKPHENEKTPNIDIENEIENSNRDNNGENIKDSDVNSSEEVKIEENSFSKDLNFTNEKVESLIDSKADNEEIGEQNQKSNQIVLDKSFSDDTTQVNNHPVSDPLKESDNVKSLLDEVMASINNLARRRENTLTIDDGGPKSLPVFSNIDDDDDNNKVINRSDKLSLSTGDEIITLEKRKRSLYVDTFKRSPLSRRRLTKTISDGDFPSLKLNMHKNSIVYEKIPRPSSLKRSRTEGEFGLEKLASSSRANRLATVSEIFARGVSGRLKMKSRSTENIRFSSLSCVEIQSPDDPTPSPVHPTSAPCRIVGVLKKKGPRDGILATEPFYPFGIPTPEIIMKNSPELIIGNEVKSFKNMDSKEAFNENTNSENTKVTNNPFLSSNCSGPIMENYSNNSIKDVDKESQLNNDEQFRFNNQCMAIENKDPKFAQKLKDFETSSLKMGNDLFAPSYKKKTSQEHNFIDVDSIASQSSGDLIDFDCVLKEASIDFLCSFERDISIDHSSDKSVENYSNNDISEIYQYTNQDVSNTSDKEKIELKKESAESTIEKLIESCLQRVPSITKPKEIYVQSGSSSDKQQENNKDATEKISKVDKNIENYRLTVEKFSDSQTSAESLVESQKSSTEVSQKSNSEISNNYKSSSEKLKEIFHSRASLDKLKDIKDSIVAKENIASDKQALIDQAKVTSKPPKPSSDSSSYKYRRTPDKASLRRRHLESESRAEKQRSNFMRQKVVRVGILKKQKSDITGVRLQKLQYFDNELPRERRRSYSLGDDLLNNSPKPKPKEKDHHSEGIEGSSTGSNMTPSPHSYRTKSEMSDYERRCQSSISTSSNSSRNSAIEKFLQSCAPCIHSSTSSTLDLSLPQNSLRNIAIMESGETDSATKSRDLDDSAFEDTAYFKNFISKARHTNRKSRPKRLISSTSSEPSSVLTTSSSEGRQLSLSTNLLEGLEEVVPYGDKYRRSISENNPSNTKIGVKDCGSSTEYQLETLHYESLISNSKINATEILDSFSSDSSPTANQIDETPGDIDYYSEILDNILSVVDNQSSPISGESLDLDLETTESNTQANKKGNDNFSEIDRKYLSREKEISSNSKYNENLIIFGNTNDKINLENTFNDEIAISALKKTEESITCLISNNDDTTCLLNTQLHKEHLISISDSDSTSSVDSELAEIRRRVTERFPPAPRDGSQASTESVLGSSPGICARPNCTTCHANDGSNTHHANAFSFDVAVSESTCEPSRVSSWTLVNHVTEGSSNSIIYARSSSLPHGNLQSPVSICSIPSESDVFRSALTVCRNEHEEEEYWSASENGDQRSLSGIHKRNRRVPVSPEDDILSELSMETCRDHSESVGNQVSEDLNQLRIENDKLQTRNRSLQREVEELRRVKESTQEEDLQLKPKVNQLTVELHHAKEALSALKADRKRLKAEKFDLLNQMKQLYATLEDKEKELRDFIRNYEQRMKESDESLRHLAAERDETEREKWNILKHARDEAERAVKLSAELNQKETSIKRLHEELDMVRKQLSSLGYLSDAESCRTNGLPTPTASTPTCSPLPLSTPTPTPNGRGSSADSGVRLSSDRDSTASHDGGPGTPKESPSLSPLYATPVSTQRGGEVIQGMLREAPPDNMAQLSAAPSLNSTLSGLANSGSSGGLSRSAEQLCERLSESGETPKLRGTATLLRNKGHKSGGTWGSISRVFARQKKRAPLDSSIYDGAGGGGGGCDKRSSWSPSSSLCASPLTEESYSEKLRLLEEAQHIPLERWKATTVLAWLEVTLGMPQYGAMCAENVRSGKVLLELSDSELEVGLGIQHPMHRKKLRLAIEELREPRLTRFPRISALNHTWVSSEWLPDLGLPQYSESFANNLVDGRLLEALTKKELEKHLGVQRKFHQASIIHGVHLLRIVRFDRQVLAERRRQCENVDIDPVVWTNHRWIRWARSIDLTEYADNLKDSGVHGALVVLETSFTADTMATALGIPQSKNIIRRHLATELESLVQPARLQLEEQARYAKLERRRQEKLAAGGSLGRSFSRSYGTGLEKGDKEKRRASLRGSLSRALGLRMREEAAANGGESSSSGGQSPSVTSRIYAHPHLKQATRPRSSHIPSTIHLPHETHRRVKSISDIESITVTPV